ncbi:FAD/NAD(P)-binding domain-containing protein [Serendipita vermifera]|nr:FAD/NAD(P)-binding domain-containing protein [Serendipita vermifera]
MRIVKVLIVGGGPGGCATALSLHQSNPSAKFLVIDDSDKEKFKIGESLPASANQILRYLSDEVFRKLNQDAQDENHIYCSGNASSWASKELQETYAIMNPFGAGLHLDRVLFEETMRASISNPCKSTDPTLGLSTLVAGRFTSVDKVMDQWWVTAEVEPGVTRTFRSKYLVDSTGRKASVAQKLNAQTIKLDSLLAFYVVFATSAEDRDRRTLIEAGESGWWYSAKLPHNRRVVAYHTDDSDPSRKEVKKLDGFLNLVYGGTTHVSQMLREGEYDPVPGTKHPQRTAANSSHLEPYCDEEKGWWAVGDAAMAFDPLSSQGIITALKSGSLLGHLLAKKIESLSDDSTSQISYSMPELYGNIRTKYEQDKLYYYTLPRRFTSEFWIRRRQRMTMAKDM